MDNIAKWKRTMSMIIRVPSLLEIKYNNTPELKHRSIKPNLEMKFDMDQLIYMSVMDIPSDMLVYAFNNKEIRYIYNINNDRPSLLGYHSNGKLHYKMYGCFYNIKRSYNIASLMLHSVNSCDPVLNDKNVYFQSPYFSEHGYLNNDSCYNPAIYIYYPSGNIHYVAYVKNGNQYFSPYLTDMNVVSISGSLPARIWYNEDGSILRKEYWYKGTHLKNLN